MMQEPYSFLGLPESQWQFINTFADWLSAVATFAAVWISLRLARKASMPQGKLKCAHVIILSTPKREYVNFSLVNTGDRPITVTGFGWRIGLFKRRYAMQLAGNGPNSELPKLLNHSETANWFVSIEDRFAGETWQQSFANKMVSKRWTSIDLWTLKAQAFTSTGHTFSVRPHPDVIKLLGAVIAEGK